jgi:hypothetical protein
MGKRDVSLSSPSRGVITIDTKRDLSSSEWFSTGWGEETAANFCFIASEETEVRALFNL